MSNALNRFLGGSPLTVIAKLILLSVLIGVVLSVLGVAFSVLGPKILGNATNIIFQGLIGKQLPPGVSKQQVVATLHLHEECRGHAAEEQQQQARRHGAFHKGHQAAA